MNCILLLTVLAALLAQLSAQDAVVLGYISDGTEVRSSDFKVFKNAIAKSSVNL